MPSPYPFVVLEAVNSVAIEHPRDCDCTVCRAAEGDGEAMAEIYATMMPGGDR